MGDIVGLWIVIWSYLLSVSPDPESTVPESDAHPTALIARPQSGSPVDVGVLRLTPATGADRMVVVFGECEDTT